MIVNVFFPPDKVELNTIHLFLAGTIDMGNSLDWQTEVILKLEKLNAKKVINVFNPRRKDWDNSWEQKLTNTKFYEQVQWELNGLEETKHVFMFFEGNSKSPVSLLELGLFARTGKMIVCCEDQFWRKGNVEIVCKRFNIPFFSKFDEAFECLTKNIIE
jgi:Nucleoside 2-deoxyribosyltransferase like